VVVVIHIDSMDIQLLKFPSSTMIVLTHMMLLWMTFFAFIAHEVGFDPDESRLSLFG
jgi:cation transporter-like permease